MKDELAKIEASYGMKKAELLVPLGKKILKRLEGSQPPELLDVAQKWAFASLNCRYEIGHNKATELVGADLDFELHELEKTLNPILEAHGRKRTF